MSKNTKPQLLYIYVILMVCLMAISNIGILNCYGLFYIPMANKLQVGLGQVTTHITISSLSTAFIIPIVSRLSKHIKIRYIIRVGVILTLIASILIGLTSSLWLIYLLSIIRGIGLASCQMLMITMVIINWFEKSRATITSIVLVCTGISAAVFSPILTNMINSLGFQNAYIVTHLLIFVGNLPAMFLLPLKPKELGITPYGEGEGKIKQFNSYDCTLNYRNIIFISIVIMGICATSLTSIASFIPSLTTSFGYSSTVAAKCLSINMIANSCFKLVYGILDDKLEERKSTSLFFAVSALGLLSLLYLSKNTLSLYASIFMFGSCYSLTTVSISMSIRRIYGKAKYGDAYAKYTLYSTIYHALLIIVIGYGYDYFKSYVLMFTIFAILAFVGLIFTNIALLKAEKDSKEYEVTI